MQSSLQLLVPPKAEEKVAVFKKKKKSEIKSETEHCNSSVSRVVSNLKEELEFIHFQEIVQLQLPVTHPEAARADRNSVAVGPPAMSAHLQKLNTKL